MFNGISVLQRQIDKKKHPNTFIQLKEDETRNRTKGIALFFIEKALVKEWIYYMIEPRRQDVLEFDKDSLKYTSFPPTFYITGDGSEIRLTAWDVENIRRKLSDKLTTYQLVRQISEPSNRSFPLRLGRFPCDWKGTQVTSHRRRIAKTLNQQPWTTFKMAWKDAEVWNFFTWHNLSITSIDPSQAYHHNATLPKPFLARPTNPQIKNTTSLEGFSRGYPLVN